MKNRQILRQKILAQRNNFNPKAYAQANDIIAQKSIALINALNLHSSIIGVYWPIAGEVDILKIFANMFPSQLTLPVIAKDNMIFACYTQGDLLVKAGLGDIYQPNSNIEVVADIIFVPGLAFNCNGYRLGFGYGYYDKYLSRVSMSIKPITVGLCFHDNLAADFTIHDRDYKLDYIITDKILIKI
jgi:5-formyltetrahydrofolate cyclo-ligase